MKKKDISAKNTSAPSYVATKHWASEFKFKLSVFPPLVTVLILVVVAAFGWFGALANMLNSQISTITNEAFGAITAAALMIIVAAIGFIASAIGWVIQVVRIIRISKFHVDFYDNGIIELHDGKGITRRIFFGFYKATVYFPTPSIILPETGAKLIKRIVCWKPLAFNYGDVTIECLEAPNDVIKLYSIKAPKELISYLESAGTKTEYNAGAECTVEFGK